MQKELRTRSPNKTQQTALQSIRKFCSNPIGLEQVSVRAFSFLQLSAIMQTYLDKHSSHRHHPSMASDWKSRWWSMSIFPCGWPHYMATRIRSATMIMYWTKINHFWTDQDHRASCNKKGALQHMTSVSVANVKQCFTSSAATHRPNWRVVYHSYTWLKMPLFNGWRHMARNLWYVPIIKK